MQGEQIVRDLRLDRAPRQIVTSGDLIEQRAVALVLQPDSVVAPSNLVADVYLAHHVTVFRGDAEVGDRLPVGEDRHLAAAAAAHAVAAGVQQGFHRPDRKSTRLNSSHVENSYAVFCL